MDEFTRYAIGSVIKHFTTTLLGQMLSNAGLTIEIHNINFLALDGNFLVILLCPFALLVGYSWDTTVREILADLDVDFYFEDPV